MFDCDGLLIDTARCWQQAFARTIRRSGRVLTQPLIDRLNGASVQSASEILGVRRGVLRTELDTAFREADLVALPGATALTRRLAAKMPLAVATNGPEAVVSDALERVKLRDAFETVVSAESQPRGKPEPDVYLAACMQLCVHPSDAIAFEDSAVGAQAALAAGLTVVLVPSDFHQKIPVDLEVGRLDDPRLASFLRLDDTSWSRTPRGALLRELDGV